MALVTSRKDHVLDFESGIVTNHNLHFHVDSKQIVHTSYMYIIEHVKWRSSKPRLVTQNIQLYIA